MSPLSRQFLLYALALVSALSAGWAAAATVYRCGPDGRLFSDQPCPGSAQVLLADTPSAAHRVEAQQVFKREQALALSLEAERHQREQAATGKRAAGILRPSAAGTAAQPETPLKQTSGWPTERRVKRHSRSRIPTTADPHLTFEVKVPAPRREASPRTRTRQAG